MHAKQKLIVALALAAGFSTAQAAPIYVGSFNVFDGPVWTSNPQVMSAREAAAMLFGGLPTDYMISVINDVNNITRTAYLDGWGDTQYLITPTSEDYKLSSRLDGGYDQSPSYSAYVCDHANCQAYGASVSSGLQGYNYTNYVFRNSVPEPASLALVGMGLLGLGLARRRKV
ncbi:MAG: PEP-CTERM sorting domain-containing protein [Gammaproteobacteria bacterium]